MSAQDDDPECAETNKDLYEILGVTKNATEAQIKRAYHKLAMRHHPDKRASNPLGSDESFKEIGYAYKVLSDADKRAVYDMGGTEALEEQEGMANISLDHLLLNILMWEAGQKICFLFVLFLVLLEAVVLPLLISVRLDGVVSWSWFAVTAPLWVPLGLAAPLLAFAPVGILVQYTSAKDDPGLLMQARATCMGCVATAVLLGAVAVGAGLLCAKLDWPESPWSFQAAAAPVYGLEALLLVTYLGAPLRAVVEGLVWKALRVAGLALLAARLDGADVPWLAVLAPLLVWVGPICADAGPLADGPYLARRGKVEACGLPTWRVHLACACCRR